MVDQTTHLPEALAELELPELLAFNNQLSKLASAGVPIRFAGAPRSLDRWLQGISSRVAMGVGLGQKPFALLNADPSMNQEYIAALSAWYGSRSAQSDRGSQEEDSLGSLRVLEPWVRKGLMGNRQVDKSALYAFWLWTVAWIASIVLIHTVWLLFPKFQRFYQNSGLEIGVGYRWMEWIYNHLMVVASVLGLLLVAAPVLWRAWFRVIARHWSLSSHFARGFFLAYLLIGGLITAVLGWTVFWPVIELLLRISEPRP
jgi:hypothetical protein